jgi:hypothetical protein
VAAAFVIRGYLGYPLNLILIKRLIELGLASISNASGPRRSSPSSELQFAHRDDAMPRLRTIDIGW